MKRQHFLEQISRSPSGSFPVRTSGREGSASSHLWECAYLSKPSPAWTWALILKGEGVEATISNTFSHQGPCCVIGECWYRLSMTKKCSSTTHFLWWEKSKIIIKKTKLQYDDWNIPVFTILSAIQNYTIMLGRDYWTKWSRINK